MIKHRRRPIDFTNKLIINIRFIKFGMVIKKCNYPRSNRLRTRYHFLFLFLLPPLLLLLLLLLRFLFLFRRERKLLHIPCFTIRNNRRNFGGFLPIINKVKTHISPVVTWQRIIFYNVLYVSVSTEIVNTIKMTIKQDSIHIRN